MLRKSSEGREGSIAFIWRKQGEEDHSVCHCAFIFFFRN